MEAIIFCGLQASGKSSFYLDQFFRTHIRINLDMLKTRNRERILIQACIEAKQPFVVDNTNPTVADRARYIAPSLDAGFNVVAYHFDASLSECLERNAIRSEEELIPERGLRGTSARFEGPTPGEGFERIHVVTLTPNGFVVREN